MKFEYDVIVVGAGHSGCEAASAAAHLGSKTLLITMDMNKTAQMSCNPAIGGIAKGQIVREIDALGGYMGIITDRTAIQFRMLNRSKGPAVWSPRAQSDRIKYGILWREILDGIPNLFQWQDTVTGFIINGNTVIGVKTQLGVEAYAKSVVLTTGTFLNGLIHTGRIKFPGGRISEPASYGLTEQLRTCGINTGRMKTGTPVRIDARSVNFDLTTEQKGDETADKFSYLPDVKRELKQISCRLVYTNEETHEILRKGLKESPIYNGQIQSTGPRYCPSIETKIVTFADKIHHQLFLEPEGENTNEYYLNGFSSSLPVDIQIKALKTIPAFKELTVYRPGYAIEYDYFDPAQLTHTLESKIIRNLFLAGQINGTTGYEEAAGQGIIAGINAHVKAFGGATFTLKRDEAYIGVLIDDLVTKGVDEPYRMFTSRAEYRILLRQDNADFRLTEKAYALGLASAYRYKMLKEKKEKMKEIISFVQNYSVKPDQINGTLKSLKTDEIRHGCKLTEILKRPQVNLRNIAHNILEIGNMIDSLKKAGKEEIIENADIHIKYEGYIAREKQIADRMNRLENIKIKNRFDYRSIRSLSTEAREKLTKIDPDTIAQASRIPGISPSDINVLLVLSGR
ncbi:MAG: tRNA uridine-5-carboxymethylaminomethyl(34) synthesis enzyme MnmG [Tannerella sp.]|jgi:tRNA uridine 5-carboxymethylaminomethyl modification enzyme|nr:tRNA uridine-5-carboxymethylaminomethyl(34) synthesis enzyme MnmG [Tannerella sp.]